MILHTIVPMEVIFDSDNKKDFSYKEMDYLGEKVEVLQYENQLVLNRLYTTDPKKYLNPDLRLGKVIKQE